MTECCTDLDEFFDGELAADRADRFRDHLPTCERCQRVLDGRMQESLVVRAPAAGVEPARDRPAVPAATSSAAPAVTALPGAPQAVGPEPVPSAARTPSRGGSARRVGCSRALLIGAPLLAAAAAVPLFLGRDPEPGIRVSVAIDHISPKARKDGAAVRQRGLVAHPSDVLRFAVRGERHQAIWVYLDERELILRCPEDARCRSADGEIALTVPLTTRGSYAIVAVGSGEALPAPGPTLDRTLATARTAGLHTQIQTVDVD